ncbi:MAG: MFS transporter, partial [Pseudomonadota bacterium]|nr:MFS transporter [Pseudomonadota bacterium]
INSIQQIVSDVFGRPELLALTFAAIGVQLAAASYLNSRIVIRFGSQRIMRWALRSFAAIAALHLAIAATFGETLPVFIVLQGLTMASFGLIAANLGAVAMAPLGHVAGTASSVQGVITTVGGALIGFAIGQAFDGTVVPLLVGITICGLLAMAMVAWSNPGSRDEVHEVHGVQSKRARREGEPE